MTEQTYEITVDDLNDIETDGGNYSLLARSLVAEIRRLRAELERRDAEVAALRAALSPTVAPNIVLDPTGEPNSIRIGGVVVTNIGLPDAAPAEISLPEQARINDLKRNWIQDPIWDIEETEGFEEYRDELKAFRLEHEAEWKANQEVELYVFQENFGINREAAMYLRNLQRRLERLEQANE